MSDSNEDERALIEAARSGDEEATSQLFTRHHEAATRYATSLVGHTQGPDLVAEAYARILGAFRRNNGPDVAFRPYLFATIRNVRIDQMRREHGEIPVDNVVDIVSGDALTTPDRSSAWAEADTVSRAFRSLPARWQAVLWHTAVEEEPLDRVAERLAMKANAVAALSFRAREGLRLAYLAEHVAAARDAECQAVSGSLPKYLRGSLPRAQAADVAAHVEGCARCAGALIELESINSNLGAVLAPVGLGALISSGALGRSASGVRLRLQQWGPRLGVAAAAGIAVALVSWSALATHAPARHTAGHGISRPQTAPPSSSPSVPPDVKGSAHARPPRTPATPTKALTLPRPSASASPKPSTPRFDARLGAPTYRQLTTTRPFWFHVAIPVRGGSGPLSMRLHLANVTAYHVRTGHGFGAWSCRASAVSVSVTVLDCRLASRGQREQDFGIDADVDAGTPQDPAVIEAALRLASGVDPVRSNNSARLVFRVTQ